LVRQNSEDPVSAKKGGEGVAGGVLCEELEPFAASSILNESIHERIIKLAVERSSIDRVIDERNRLGEEFPVSHVRG